MSVIDLATYSFDLVLNDKGFDSSLSNAENKVEKLDNKANKLTSFLKTTLVAGVATAGAALGAMAVAGVKGASDLESAMLSLQAATGSSDEEIKSMEEYLKNIYTANYGESFEDIANAMVYVKQTTGLANEELEKTTKNALMIKETFGAEINESVRAANQLMTHFGITSDEAMTLLAQGFQNGLDKSGDFLDTINEYSVYFNSLGYDAEQFFNTLIAGSESGAFNLDKVADAVKEFGIRTKDMSDASRDGFEALGLDAEEMFSLFANGGQDAQKATQQVFNALNKLDDPLKRNKIGIALMGTQFEDLEASSILALTNIDGVVNSTSDTLSQIDQLKYDSFGEALQGIGRNFNLALIEPMQTHVLPLLNQLGNWILEQMPTIQAVVEGAFGAVGSAISSVIEMVKSVIDAFKGANTETSTQFTSIKNTVTKILDSVKSVISGFVSLAKEIWQKYGEDIVAYAQSTWENISNVIESVLGVIRGIIQTVTSLISGDWEGVLQGLKTIASNTWEGIKSLIKQALDAIVFIIRTVGDALKDAGIAIFELLWEGIKWVWDKLSTWVSDSFNSVLSFITGLGTKFYEAGEEIFTFLWNGIKNIWSSITNWVSEKVNWLVDKLMFWKSSKDEMEEDVAEINSYSSPINVPSYDVGTPFVPKTGLALIHEGEAIIPEEYNPYAPGSKFNPSSLNPSPNATYNIEISPTFHVKEVMDLTSVSKQREIAYAFSQGVTRQMKLGGMPI